MARIIKLEDRELYTIADLLHDKLQRGAAADGAFARRSYIRLALVLNASAADWGGRLAVIRRAPRWVYQYLGKHIIDLAPAPKPKARRAAKPRPAGSGAARSSARRTPAAIAGEEEE